MPERAETLEVIGLIMFAPLFYSMGLLAGRRCGRAGVVRPKHLFHHAHARAYHLQLVGLESADHQQLLGREDSPGTIQDLLDNDRQLQGKKRSSRKRPLKTRQGRSL